jgi:hypothetical protein
MSRALIGALLVLASVFGPLAAAVAVPDPTWIGGVYDGGDSDDLVLLVWELSPGVVHAAPVVFAPRAWVSGTGPTPRAPVHVAAAASDSRAPPLA